MTREKTPADLDFLGRPLGGFLDAVASREPAPGGGAAAAVAVALAAGLCSMAARFSGEHLEDAAALAGASEALRRQAGGLARTDAEVYGRVLEAYRLPRKDPEVRRRRIHEALLAAADVPLSVAETGAEVADIAARLSRSGNPNLKGDAVSAALLAEAATRAAAALVGINTTSSGDAGHERRERASELAEAASRAARRIGEVTR